MIPTQRMPDAVEELVAVLEGQARHWHDMSTRARALSLVDSANREQGRAEGTTRCLAIVRAQFGLPG